jgi:hypothetical protein
MSEQMNVPDDLKLLYECDTEWPSKGLTEWADANGIPYRPWGNTAQVVLRRSLIERIAALEAENAVLRQRIERLSAPVTDGVGRIAAERKRQIEQEGWTPEHDEEHRCGELARAACGYAALASYQAGPRNLVDDPLQPPILPRDWPWDVSWWKPSHDLIRNLVKAGALIAAEIDRLAARKESK